MAYITEIPFGAYWSTPTARWQGSFANLHAIKFAAYVTRNELAKRQIDPRSIDHGVLGSTVPQQYLFYGLPWLAGMAGLDHIAGPTLSQACATSVRCLLSGTQEIEAGLATTVIAIAADRVSNGPQIYYPNPAGPGGTGKTENWTLDNFSCDPLGGHSMIQTAENVAKEQGINTEQQHEIVLRRQEQYADALSDDRAFHKRFMSLPFDIPKPNFKKNAGQIQGDEGITESTVEGLAKLRPILEGGSITYGGQTHPADANAAIILATPDKARELSSKPEITINVLGFGQARVGLALMPKATVPAAIQALAQADLAIDQLDAIKTHNPFALNDIYFANEFGVDVMSMNNYGCSLIWGHPQAPMGMRSIIELIEELALRGGGTGLFSGCAGGDTAMAIVIQVSDRT
jgi:acetyl-CoA acetyltransferase